VIGGDRAEAQRRPGGGGRGCDGAGELEPAAVLEWSRRVRFASHASVPANPAFFGPSDEWAGHYRRYTRQALLELCADGGLTVERLEPWGFPVSSFYHRRIYEPRLSAQGPAEPRWYLRPAIAALGAALQLDRLFVGVERGALGYLLLTRRPGS